MVEKVRKYQDCYDYCLRKYNKYDLAKLEPVDGGFEAMLGLYVWKKSLRDKTPKRHRIHEINLFFPNNKEEKVQKIPTEFDRLSAFDKFSTRFCSTSFPEMIYIWRCS